MTRTSSLVRNTGRTFLALSLTGFSAAASLPAYADPPIKSIASFIGNGSVGSYINGTEPRNGVTLDSSGNIFGTAYYGGDSNQGTVYEVVKGTNTVKALTSFSGYNSGGSPGAYPSGNIVMDGGGNIYGTTETGGSANSGTIYKLPSGASTATTLVSFDRGQRVGGLVSDSSGNLYGSIHYGGTLDYSVVYELLNGSSAVTTLATFNPSFSSISALTLDGSGNIFGTTFFGGAFNNGNSYGNGSIFEITKGSGTVTTLASFNGTNGYNPLGGITFDGAGNMFGTTQLGGAFNKGTIFEFAKGSTTITALASFTTNTNSTQAAVTLDSAGNIFGTTPYGGPSASGSVYELVKGSSAITTLASFNGADGGGPFTKVTLDGNGNLYGTTIRGGASGGGTIFGIPGVGSPAAVPEASSVVSLGLLLGLGGVCLAVRKRAKPAA
jgi:uncharacterized repeat protein (TIGR03803 family)